MFDYEKAAGFLGSNGETEYSTRQAAIRILKCHGGRTKRIVTEDSPDLFLTVGEVSIYPHYLIIARVLRRNCLHPVRRVQSVNMTFASPICAMDTLVPHRWSRSTASSRPWPCLHSHLTSLWWLESLLMYVPFPLSRSIS